MAELRHLEGRDELAACVELQRRTWGEAFSECVPASILQVSQKIGGMVGGAWEDERLVGFVYSLIGFQAGRPAHWSHMLAVDPDARGRGLGRRLKLFQRDELLKRGVKRVFWTFDPMVARNAHLNLNRLGATVVGFVPNMYGEATGSPLHDGPTDRFILRWDLDSQRVRWAVEREVPQEPSEAFLEAPAIRPSENGALESNTDLPGTDAVRIEIPCDLTETMPEALPEWRALVREAFLKYLRRGYAVQSFHRESSPTTRCAYFLRRP